MKISPQNIDDSLLDSIVGSNLTHFHIVQNENTPKTAVPCSVKAWSRFKRYASEQLKLHLDAISKRKNGCELLVQPEAPVHSITCENVRDHLLTFEKSKTQLFFYFLIQGKKVCRQESSPKLQFQS